MTGTRPPAAVTTAEERFRAMFARHHPAVLAYAARRIGRSDAADAAAETFTVAWRRLARVPEEPATLPWLYGVARNVVRNHLRARRRAERLAMRQAGEPGPAPTVSDPEILEALGRLDRNDREILMLAAWEGLAPVLWRCRRRCGHISRCPGSSRRMAGSECCGKARTRLDRCAASLATS